MIDWKKIEEKWQKKWEEKGVFDSDPDYSKPKYYLTVAYPYTNSPQHIGHGRTYTLTDVHARYRRMLGYNVLFPMAWHFTGTPIIAMVERLKEKDPDILDTFINLYKVPRDRLHELETPIGMAKYFQEEIYTGMKKIGFSIDWRRQFTTVDPIYSKFIEWQFTKLKQRGYITQGSHPVGWCPNCGNPVGQHDTIGDIEPEIEEFIVVKFDQGGEVYPTATLRPETVFGVTNIWVNPEADYVKAKVKEENWIVSVEAVEKLKYLGYDIEVSEAFSGSKLIGLILNNPFSGSEISILPASFVDPKNATGVVMSVPAHAPFDYIALKNIKKTSKKSLEKIGLKPSDLNKIEPVSIIELPDWGESPAVEIVEKTGITDQNDPRLEKLTRQIYSQEFHNGRMRGNTGPYANMTVKRAKEVLIEDLLADEKAVLMYELMKPVRCRCGSDVVVKIFEHQWFIDYGDPAWKKLAHENLENMEIIPRELKREYVYVIDWLDKKACARNVGLGTKLPWDDEWIIEALSDSTIYMAFYTVIKDINKKKIDPELLGESFWDYIFLDKEFNADIIDGKFLDEEEMNKIKAQFEYYYPLDARHSGRDLISNHLTFMIFNHDAIWSRDNWPRGIFANGFVLMEGQKMSKSLNNIIPIAQAIERFGADPLRLSLMITAEPLKDADFSPDLAASMSDLLEKFYGSALQTIKEKIEGEVEYKNIDKWMLSRLQRTIDESGNAMKEMKVRKTLHSILYNLNKSLEWYSQRVKMDTGKNRKKAIHKVLNEILEVQVKILTPFTPHICEEIWESMGNEGFVSFESWPKPDLSMINPEIEEEESLLQEMREDIKKINKVTEITPKKIHIYTAPAWKWNVYLKALDLAKSEKIEIGTLIQESFKNDELKALAGKVPPFARSIVEDIKKTSIDTIKRRVKMGILNETRLLQDAVDFYESEFKCEVHVYVESDPWIHDPQKRASRSKPYKPAIFVE
jgi:leucyl-tRNA synthetase